MSTAIGVLAAAAVIGAALAAQLAATYQRAPWCWCGHDREVHHHDRPGSDCSRCGCPRLRLPVIRRAAWNT